ncbi:MAG: hypothetical protein ABR530_06930 [Pyrinomonadaceae bacterium]
MKKTLTAITLALMLTASSTFAHGGIRVSDKRVQTCQSAETDGIIVFGKNGIIVFGAAIQAITGIIVFGAKESSTCTESTVTKNGIIVFG